MGNTANVILVGMGQDYCFNRGFCGCEAIEVRNIQAASQRWLLRKHDTAIDNSGAACALDGHKVAPNFAQPSKRDDFDTNRSGDSIRHHPLPPSNQAVFDYIERLKQPKA